MIQSICVKTIKEALTCLQDILEKKEEAGEKNLVFAEDRLTLLAEQAICSRLGGSFLSDVTTFSRYLSFEGERTLSKQGSVMKIGEIILKNQKELACFNKPYSAASSARVVYETIAQFASCRILPKTLSHFSSDDVALTKKIHDIALIDEEYLSFLENEGFADENTLLSLLPAALESDASLPQKNVIFLAFGSFTGQALEGIRVCFARAKNCVGIFLNGEEEYYTGEAEERFYSVAEEFGGAKRYSYPSKLNPVQRAVASALYSPEVFRVGREKVSAEGISVFECENKSEEARLAAAIIQRAVANGKRYKEITLFVPDVKGYYGELKRNFDAYAIPCFADVKRPLSSHPVAFFLLSLLDAADEHASPAAVKDVVSSLFFGESGNYQNYLDEFVPYRGGALKEIKKAEVLQTFGYDLEEIRAARERFLTLYDMIPERDTAEGFVERLKKALAFVNAQDLLEKFIAEEEDAALVGYLNQIYPTLEKVFAEVAALSGNKKFTAGEFHDILSDGFEAAEISLIPIKNDAVFIGDLSSSKVGESKIVLALGLTEQVPLYSSDVSLISDKEILHLKKGNIDVEPLVSEVNLRSRETVCENLLSFSEELYLLYPITAGGGEHTKSEILTYLLRGMNLKTEKEKDFFPYSASSFAGARRLFFAEEEKMKRDANRSRKVYSALEKLLAGKVQKRGEKENIPCGEELFFRGKGLLSPTLLENFNTCPYRNFVDRGLRLKERKEGLIRLNDAGVFVHAMLSAVGEGIQKQIVFDDASCEETARRAGEEILSSPAFSSLSDSPADSYFARRLISDGVTIAKEVYHQVKERGFSIEKVEEPYRMETLSLYGIIDRIDCSEEEVRVIDYKTGEIDDSLTPYYMGTKLQLELYTAAALEKNKNKTPAGAFYFPARIDFSSADEKESAFALKGVLVEESSMNDTDGIVSKKSKKVKKEDFPYFLRYAEAIASHSADLLKKGYIAPSPCSSACKACAYKGMCLFTGEDRESAYSKLKAEDFAALMREESDE